MWIVVAVMQEVRGIKELPPVPITDDICVLLCLYGEGEPPELTVQPDRLYFSDSSVGVRWVESNRQINTEMVCCSFKGFLTIQW